MLGRLALSLRLVSLLLVLAVPEAFAQGQSKPLTIQHNGDLEFGSYSADSTLAGTVTISPNSDSATAGGGAVSFGGVIRRGEFTLSGNKNAFVVVTLPSSMTIEDGSGNSMTIDNFTMNGTNPIQLGNNGRFTLFVGATLNISVNQTGGTYDTNNTFIVDAVYQ